MSRQIDLTEKLSDEDRDYLLARGREQLVLQNDAQFTEDPDVRAAADYIPGTSVDVAAGVPHTPDADPLVVNGGGLVQGFPPETFRTGQAQNEADEQGSDEDPGYEGWKKKALQSEIARRNEEYTEEYQISKEGTIAELAARLRADDEDEAEDDGNDGDDADDADDQDDAENTE